jgi:hypothetical protein
VPGEKIHFTVDIENKSETKLTDVSLKLVQEIKLIAKEKPKCEKNECEPIYIPRRVEAHSVEKWTGTYQIPFPLDTSLNGLCRIIEVNYLFVMRIKIGLLSMAKELSLPLTIGMEHGCIWFLFLFV